MSDSRDVQYVSRGGLKLAHALDHFGIEPAGLECADLGCNVGGFVDCLLRRGATKVYAVDTGYGALDWSLRSDARVEVMERTNALEVVLPQAVRLVTVDVGWTRQQLVLPRALDLLEPEGIIVTLIKPHYEAERKLLRSGRLPDHHVDDTVQGVIARLADLGICIEATVESPIRGEGGNREVLGWIRCGQSKA